MIPERELKYFERFYIMATKALSTMNLTEEDINEFEKKFRAVTIVMQSEFFDDAHRMMGTYLMQLQHRRREGVFLTL